MPYNTIATSPALAKPESGRQLHLWAACLLALFSSAAAQNYPLKTVRIVSSGPGGSADFAARLIAQEITPALGQRVIVENRPSGVIPADVVARSAPDGHTLLVASSVLWIVPLLQSAPFDAVRDFAPVSMLSRIPNMIVVHPSLPVKSVRDLIALGKARPGVINYASTSVGGSTHLAAEYFKLLAGVDMLRINYKGTGPALNALMAGEVQAMFPTAGSTSGHVKSGRLRALAVGSAQPSALLPGVPTIAATGLPGYESVAMYGMFAPAKTPAPAIRRLNEDISRLLWAPDLMEKLLNAGTEPGGGAPDQFANIIKAEMTRLGKLIRNVGIRDK